MTDLVNEKKVVGWLVCYKGKLSGRCWSLHDGYNSVGYGAEQDVSLGDVSEETESLQFFIVYDNRKNEFHLVLDEDSKPISINGQRVQEFQKIEGKTCIIFGMEEYVFVPFCGDEYKWT